MQESFYIITIIIIIVHVVIINIISIFKLRASETTRVPAESPTAAADFILMSSKLALENKPKTK